MESGRQICPTKLVVPTVNRFYCSQLDPNVSYGLSTFVVLGNDWVSPGLPDSLTPPHYQ